MLRVWKILAHRAVPVKKLTFVTISVRLTVKPLPAGGEARGSGWESLNVLALARKLDVSMGHHVSWFPFEGSAPFVHFQENVPQVPTSFPQVKVDFQREMFSAVFRLAAGTFLRRFSQMSSHEGRTGVCHTSCLYVTEILKGPRFNKIE